MSHKKYILEKIEYRAVIKYLFLKGNSSKEIYDDDVRFTSDVWFTSGPMS